MMAPVRFTGTVHPLGTVDVSGLVAWIAAIPFTDWPQQSPWTDGSLRPAMVNDLRWHGFGAVSASVVRAVLAWAPGGVEQARLLSVIMPGHAIPEHTDRQRPTWWARVHVPLTTNARSAFRVGGVAHHLEVGRAYLVNTEAPHSVTNEGNTPRIHLMVDVGGAV